MALYCTDDRGGGEGWGDLIPFHAEIEVRLKHQVSEERKTSNLSCHVRGFREILMFGQTERYKIHGSHIIQGGNHVSASFINSQIMPALICEIRTSHGHLLYILQPVIAVLT